MFPRQLRPARPPLFTLAAFALIAGCDTTSFSLAGLSPAASFAAPAGGGPLPAAAKQLVPDNLDAMDAGNLASANDVTVFSLGAGQAGERITIDVTGNGGLNTVAALFNQNDELIDANDDRSYYNGIVDPYISVILRENASDLKLAVAISRGRYFTSNQGRFNSGSFQVRVQRAPGQTFGTNPQVLWLDFNGAPAIRIAQEPALDVPPFDAGQIVAGLSAQNEYIKDLVVDKIRTDLAPFDVTVLRSDRDSVPTGEYSTIYFGGYNEQFLGLSDNVDSYNLNNHQKSVIYTDTLRLFASLRPNADSVAQGVANVAAHEIGHLLGLEHTSDPNDLMAIAATAQQVFFVDASYRRASLHSELFPAGYQNGAHQIELALGAAGNSSFDQMTQKTVNDRLILPDLDSGPVDAREPGAHLRIPMCNRAH